MAEIATRVGVGIVVAGILYAVRGALRLPVWTLLPFLAVTLVAITLIGRRARVVRALELAVLKEPSAAQCSDRFIDLLTLVIGGSAATFPFERIDDLLTRRRHPNTRLFQPIRPLLDSPGPMGADAREHVLDYLSFVRDMKGVVRRRVTSRVRHLLRETGREVLLVLYGYSSAVCESIVAAARTLEATILVVEDLQYGDNSLGEHHLVERELARGGLTSHVLQFEEIEKLYAPEANFIHTVEGRRVALFRQRRIISIIGCEAVDASGRVLVPSRLRGEPSGTAKFVEVVNGARVRQRGDGVSAEIWVVTESYKMFDTLDEVLSTTHAPVQQSWLRDALYVWRLRGVRQSAEVELVTLGPDDIQGVVDDVDAYFLPDDLVRVQTSLRRWEDQTIDQVTPRPPGPNVRAAFSEATLIVFDLNGVLVDDEIAHMAAFDDVVRARGGAGFSTAEYARYCSGLTDEEGVENLLAAGRLVGDVASLVAEKQRAYERRIGESGRPAAPGAVDLLRHLRSLGKTIVLVTASSQKEGIPLLEGLGARDVFDEAYFGVRRPQRVHLLRDIAEAHAGGRREALLVDDSPANLRTATNLGYATIGICATRDVSPLDAQFLFPDIERLRDEIVDEALPA